jgi:hypothetical protein
MGSLECPQVVVGVEDRGTLDSLINASLQWAALFSMHLNRESSQEESSNLTVSEVA